MDNRIRQNELCSIGLPRCDYVFSSTRTCFIGFSFDQSSLERTIIERILKERSIEPIDADRRLAPGQNAFCTKICSKIITSQFCVIILNNDVLESREVPNANVNMEYGLMLGFNKYVIPFQKTSQQLPFNVAGLDTIKYSDRDFEAKAMKAIDEAINATQQKISSSKTDQVIESFLLLKKALVTPIDNEGDRNIFRLGQPLGFALLNDFSGMNYFFFGNFSALRAEAIIWRLETLREILDGRFSSLEKRVEMGILKAEQLDFMVLFRRNIKIWVVVTSDDDKKRLLTAIDPLKFSYGVSVFSLSDIEKELEALTEQNESGKGVSLESAKGD